MPLETTALVCYCRHMSPASSSALRLEIGAGWFESSVVLVVHVTDQAYVTTYKLWRSHMYPCMQCNISWRRPGSRLSCVSSSQPPARSHWLCPMNAPPFPCRQAPQHTVVCGEQTERRNKKEKRSVSIILRTVEIDVQTRSEPVPLVHWCTRSVVASQNTQHGRGSTLHACCCCCMAHRQPITCIVHGHTLLYMKKRIPTDMARGRGSKS
jgi:hypothetical protein